MPVIETFDEFWVKNEDPMFDVMWDNPFAYQSGKKPACYYYNRKGLNSKGKITVQLDYCLAKKSYVCEKSIFY